MPIGSTTHAALRTAVAARIIAIDPDHTRNDTPWRRVRAKSDVPGPSRNFYISIENLRRPDNGLFTTGLASYEADLKIWTGYGGMSDEDFEDISGADMRQLWVALSAATGPITGLLNIAHGDPLWEDGEESAEGARYGAHVFLIHYLLDQP